MRHRHSSLLIIITLLVCTGAHAQPASEGPAAAPALVGQLKDVTSFHGAFVQFTQDARGNRMQQVEGRVWVERPNRFRWEADAPQNQQIVSDGIHTWFYDEDLEQVIVREFDPDISRTPLMLLGSDPAVLESGFDVAMDDVDAERRFALTPREPDALFERLELIFVGAELVSIRMVDALGQRTYVEFSSTQYNGEIDPALFTFDVPEGVDLIEDIAASQ